MKTKFGNNATLADSVDTKKLSLVDDPTLFRITEKERVSAEKKTQAFLNTV